MSMTITQSSKRDVVQKISELIQQLNATDHQELHQTWKNVKVKVTDRISRIELLESGLEFERIAKLCVEDLQKLQDTLKKLGKKHKELNNTLYTLKVKVDEVNTDIRSLCESLIKTRTIDAIEDSQQLSKQATKSTCDSELINNGIDFVDKLKDKIRSIQTDRGTITMILPLVEEMNGLMKSISYWPPDEVMDEIDKHVQLLDNQSHADIKDKWEQIHFLISDGESANTLQEHGLIFRQHVAARIATIQMEVETYKRLETKQRGLNQMMSTWVFQNTVIEQDIEIKKELNWLGSWFGIGSSASLQKRLQFDGGDDDGERVKSPVPQPNFNPHLYEKGKAFAEKLRDKINRLILDLKSWKRLIFLAEQMTLFWNKSNYTSPFLEQSRISFKYDTKH